MNSAPLRVDDRRIKVIVVDDSAVVRGLITRHLTADPAIDVVTSAANGELAVAAQARFEADVMILDIEMPVMDGLTALPILLSRHPNLTVIVASTLSRRNAEISLKALELGAADFLTKPEGGLGAADDFHRQLLASVKGLARRQGRGLDPAGRMATVATPAGGQTARPGPRLVRRPLRPDILALGASTGGPPALLKLFESLRGAIRQPILLTQHMPATFTALLAEQLSRAGGRPCAEARDGEAIEPGRAYVAPGGFHMVVERAGGLPILRLSQEPPEHFCRPAVDPMLRSVAREYGGGALAVILTGMGADGARGCVAVAEAGGRFIVQDEATSVVWGMPGAAAATGKADDILPLAEIGPWVRRAMEVTP